MLCVHSVLCAPLWVFMVEVSLGLIYWWKLHGFLVSSHITFCECTQSIMLSVSSLSMAYISLLLTWGFSNLFHGVTTPLLDLLLELCCLQDCRSVWRCWSTAWVILHISQSQQPWGGRCPHITQTVWSSLRCLCVFCLVFTAQQILFLHFDNFVVNNVVFLFSFLPFLV